MSDIDLPKPFSRLFAGPIDDDTIFDSVAELNAYLTNPKRYPGQKATVVENGNVQNYQLNGLGNAWDIFDKEIVEESSSVVDEGGIAGETVGTNRVIICDVDGKYYHADSSDISHVGKVIGISKNATLTDEDIDLITSGSLEDQAFTFNPGQSVFFDTQGALTQTPPSVGFIQVVGTAVSPTKVLVGIKSPVILA